MAAPTDRDDPLDPDAVDEESADAFAAEDVVPEEDGSP